MQAKPDTSVNGFNYVNQAWVVNGVYTCLMQMSVRN